VYKYEVDADRPGAEADGPVGDGDVPDAGGDRAGAEGDSPTVDRVHPAAGCDCDNTVRDHVNGSGNYLGTRRVPPQAGLAVPPVPHAPRVCLVRLVLLPQWRPPPTVLPLPVDAHGLAHPSQGGLPMSLSACRGAAEAATGVVLTVGSTDVRGGASRAVKRGFVSRDASSRAAAGGHAAAAGARLDGGCIWVRSLAGCDGAAAADVGSGAHWLLL